MKNLRKKLLALIILMSISAGNLYCMEMFMPEDIKRYIASIYIALTFGYSFSFVEQLQLDENITFLEFGPDGKSIHAAASKDGVIFRWDLEGQKFIKNFELNYDSEINYFTCNFVKNFYIVGIAPDITCLCSAQGKELHSFGLNPDFDISCAAFSLDGKLALTSYNNGGGILWDTASKKIIKQIISNKDCWAATFSPDNEKIAFGSNDQIGLHNLKTDQTIYLMPFKIAVAAIAFSPDGKTILGAGWDRTIHLWDSETGEPLNRLNTAELDEDIFISVLFSIDGKVALALSPKGKIHFWDIKSTELIKTFEDTVDTKWIWLSPDGKNVAVLLEDGRLNIWKALYAPELKIDAFNKVLHLLAR